VLSAQESPRFLLSKDFRQLIVDQLSTEDWQKLSNYKKVSQQVLSIQLNQEPNDALPSPAMLGKYRLNNRQIIFQPILPFQAGQSYTADLLGQYTFDFFVPKKTNKTAPLLTGISPSAKQVPANLLKIYLHFSQKMSEGQAYKHLSLIDQKGHKVEGAFLELYPELWDKEKRRLTIWFDPGRVKRNLGPNQQTGSPLEPGQVYRLQIDAHWPNAEGIPLGKNYEYNWQVEKAVYQTPKLEQWQYEWPAPNSLGPLKIKFDRSMDRAVAMKAFSIFNADDDLFPGHFEMEQNETVLLFYPKQVWSSGHYHVQVAAYLEDLAGNNLNRPFDLDLSNSPTQIRDQEFYQIPFLLEEEK